MQSVSSRIWTRVAVSISYDDNDYTIGTPIKLMISIEVDAIGTVPKVLKKKLKEC